MKSKKKRFAPARTPVKPCKKVVKNEIAAMLNPTVAVAGRRLNSFWKDELLI